MGTPWKDRSDFNKSLLKFFAISSLSEKDEESEETIGEEKSSFWKWVGIFVAISIVLFVFLSPATAIIAVLGLHDSSGSAFETAMGGWYWWLLSAIVWGGGGFVLYKNLAVDNVQK